MKQFLVLLVLVGLALPAFGDVANCYFGWTQDSDADPEEDWEGTTCVDNPGADVLGCVGVACEGDNAACFKVRWEGDDEFVSIYGCVDDTTSPSDGESRVPGGFGVDDLYLSKLPTEDEECEEDDDTTSFPDLTGTPVVALGGDEINGAWCTCMDSKCNGAEKATAASAALVSVFVAMAI